MNSRKTQFWFWLIFAILGQTVALQMIRAGNQLRYQHYPPLTLLIQETSPLMLALFGFQIVAASVGLFKYRREIFKWITDHFKPLAIIFIGAVFVLTSATVSHDVSTYITEVVFAAFIQFVNLGNLVLVVLSSPDEWVSRIHSKLVLRFGKPGLDVESRG